MNVNKVNPWTLYVHVYSGVLEILSSFVAASMYAWTRSDCECLQVSSSDCERPSRFSPLDFWIFSGSQSVWQFLLNFFTFPSFTLWWYPLRGSTMRRHTLAWFRGLHLFSALNFFSPKRLIHFFMHRILQLRCTLFTFQAFDVYHQTSDLISTHVLHTTTQH